MFFETILDDCSLVALLKLTLQAKRAKFPLRINRLYRLMHRAFFVSIVLASVLGPWHQRARVCLLFSAIVGYYIVMY